MLADFHRLFSMKIALSRDVIAACSKGGEPLHSLSLTKIQCPTFIPKITSLTLIIVYIKPFETSILIKDFI